MTDSLAAGQNARERLRLRHFRLLDHIATTGSLSAAASAMHLAQPAASQMLQDLEAAFGVVLVERGTKGSRLSPAGSVALQRMRSALHAVDVAAEAVMHPEPRPILRLGMVPAMALRAMPELMRHMGQHAEPTRFILMEADAPALMQAMHAGELDVIVTRLERDMRPGDDAFVIEPLDDRPIVVVGNVRHPLRARGKIATMQELAACEWVLPPSTTGLGEIVGSYFSQAGVAPPDPALQSRSLHTNLAVVAGSKMLTVASLAVVRRYAQALKIGVVRVEVELPRIRTVYIRRADATWPALEEIGSVLRRLQV